MVRHAASGRLPSLTVPEMQCWLRARKAAVGGKKADLEARVAAEVGLPPPAAAQKTLPTDAVDKGVGV